MVSLMEAYTSMDNQRIAKDLTSLGLTKIKEVLGRKNPLLEALRKYLFQTLLNLLVALYPLFLATIEVNSGYDKEKQKNKSFQ